MRRLRLALIKAGLARSFGVIELMMASTCPIAFSAVPSGIRLESWPISPGIFDIRFSKPPIFRICWICALKSFRSKLLPLRSFFAISAAAASSMPFWTSSTKVRTSPIPKTRLAIRSGWKASKPSIFSPTPMNLIGLPVTWRTDKAAPPRESPSILVNTTPVSGSASLKACAVLTAS